MGEMRDVWYNMRIENQVIASDNQIVVVSHEEIAKKGYGLSAGQYFKGAVMSGVDAKVASAVSVRGRNMHEYGN